MNTQRELIDRALQVESLDADRLFVDWKWLYPEPVTLVARNAFGDLFFKGSAGTISWLQVDVGRITKIAASSSVFLEQLSSGENRETWLLEQDTRAFAEHGLQPGALQCIGFKIPIVFAEAGTYPDNAYIADLYEQVSFLGDLHRQLAEHPDGTKIKLVIKK